MLEHTRRMLWELEGGGVALSLPDVLAQLRRETGLDDFIEIMLSMPMERYPRLSAVLPRMPEGRGVNEGALRRYVAFLRSAAYNYVTITKQPLLGKRILEFGCGDGELSRLLYFFTGPESLFGVDSSAKAIESCGAMGVGGQFLVCGEDGVAKLPEGVRADFIVSYRAFTLLSSHATVQAMEACRHYLSDSGVMMMAIRPIESWRAERAETEGRTLDAIYEHRAGGFAHLPGAEAGGDTTMTTDWISQNFRQWRIACVDRSLDDPLHIYVFLKPRLAGE